MGKMILGTKTFEYVMVGVVPPGVADDVARAEILRSVSWSGGILSATRDQRVILHEKTVEEVGALLERRNMRLE